MDRVRLKYYAKDELYPDVKDLTDTMNRLSLIPSNFEGKEKVCFALYLHCFNYFLRVEELNFEYIFRFRNGLIF